MDEVEEEQSGPLTEYSGRGADGVALSSAVVDVTLPTVVSGSELL